MIAYDVYEPRCVLVLAVEIGAIRLRWSDFERDWCKGLKGVHKARRKGLLVEVHEVQFDRAERRWRVERDCIERNVLIIGPSVAFTHTLRDDSDRDLFRQMDDLFVDHQTANEAANCVAVLARRRGGTVETVAVTTCEVVGHYEGLPTSSPLSC